MRISFAVLILAASVVSGGASAQTTSFLDVVAKLLQDGGQPYRVCHLENGGYCEMGVQINYLDGTAIFSSITFDASERPLNRFICSRNAFADTTRCIDWDRPTGWQCNMKGMNGAWANVLCQR